MQAGMGRTAAKQEQQQDVIDELTKIGALAVAELKKYHDPLSASRHVGVPSKDVEVVGKMKRNDVCNAQRIVASRVKMEGSAMFNPVPFLDDEAAKLYQEPFHQGLADIKNELQPPRVRIHASMTEKIALLRLLDKAGRLGFRSPDEPHLGFGSGLFCVPKNLEVDRLILDGRPANMLQIEPRKFIMTMGSALGLLGIPLGPNEKLVCSGDDLSIFFYTFQVGYDRGSRNFLDWKIPTELVRGFPSFPPEYADKPHVYACLTTLAMGDSAACSYAQTSHLALALQCAALDAYSLVTLHSRTPRGDVFGGIIIDDFILMQKISMSDSAGADIRQRRANMHSMYKRVGLDAHLPRASITRRRLRFGELTWMELVGWCVVTLLVLFRYAGVLHRSLHWALLRLGLLEVIAGGFVALFCFRRRMMSLLDGVYRLQVGRDRKDVVALPTLLVDELWSLVSLCPLAVSDLRADYFEEVFMVDASNWGEAVVSSSLPTGLQSEIHRHCLLKSCWTRLLSPFKSLLRGKGCLPTSDELPGGEVVFAEHPVWETAARCLPYKLVWKKHAATKRHINVGKLRAYLKAERNAGAKRGDVRVPIGGDSQVVAGCICKGRSASGALNREMQRSLPLVLGFESQRSCNHSPAAQTLSVKTVSLESSRAFARACT